MTRPSSRSSLPALLGLLLLTAFAGLLPSCSDSDPNSPDGDLDDAETESSEEADRTETEPESEEAAQPEEEPESDAEETTSSLPGYRYLKILDITAVSDFCTGAAPGADLDGVELKNGNGAHLAYAAACTAQHAGAKTPSAPFDECDRLLGAPDNYDDCVTTCPEGKDPGLYSLGCPEGYVVLDLGRDMTEGMRLKVVEAASNPNDEGGFADYYALFACEDDQGETCLHLACGTASLEITLPVIRAELGSDTPASCLTMQE